MPPEAFQQVNLRTCFYIAALLGLVALVNETGLGRAPRSRCCWRSRRWSPGAPVQNFAVLTGIATILTLLVTANGAPALYTALAGEMAQASGLSPLAVVLGAGDRLLDRCSSPTRRRRSCSRANSAASGSRDATRLTLAFGIASLLVAAPLDLRVVAPDRAAEVTESAVAVAHSRAALRRSMTHCGLPR